MQENISPEERLLNLIKNGKGKAKETVPEDKKAEGPAKEAEQQIQKEPERVKGLRHAPVKMTGSGIKYFSLFNRILVIIGIFTIAYLVLAYVRPYKLKESILEKAERTQGREAVTEIMSQAHPLSYYADIIGKRQMFKLFEAPAQKQAGPPKPKITLSQLLSGYTFVGIIFGDVPQAIVEEKKSGQSFYLVGGQYLGEIRVDKVEQGKITVSHEGESMDIRI